MTYASADAILRSDPSLETEEGTEAYLFVTMVDYDVSNGIIDDVTAYDDKG